MNSATPLSYLCACACIAAPAFSAMPRDADAWTTHETSVGVSETVSLTDGSSVQLNTSTRLLVLSTESRRSLKLRSGEAFLQVTGGPPIDLTVGNLLVSSSAAAFGARAYSNGDIDIMVLDGAVIVRYPAIESPHPSKYEQPTAWPVSAGQLTAVRGSHVYKEDAGGAYIERKLAWRNQRLEFLDEPIGNIVDEFNRYGHARLSVKDPYIRELHVAGFFVPTDPAAFAATVSELFALKVETQQTRSGLVIRLLQTSKTTHATQTPEVPVPPLDQETRDASP